MPTLVHIADAKLIARITKSGIVPGKWLRAVYFMPVVHSHFISHQWMRELRRHGARTLAGVYFRLPSREVVWAGRYTEAHRQVSLGQAIRVLMDAPDPLGYEMFIERKILPQEITRIRSLPQKVGWRYMPHAHGKPLCGCPLCLPKGGMKSRALRAHLDPQPPRLSYEAAKKTLASSRDPKELTEALWALYGKRRRRADPSFLEPLLAFDDADVLQVLAFALGCFRHENTKRLLTALSTSTYEIAQKAAMAELEELYGEPGAAGA